jgi:acid phosphatase type 7
MKSFKSIYMLIAILLLTELSFSHVRKIPSVHDTVDGILQRMKTELSANEIKSLSREKVISFLTTEEKMVLSSGFLTFEINSDADLYLAVDPGARAPFWLTDEGFEKTELTMSGSRDGIFEVWKKSIKAGDVGLGVNSIYGGGKHYVAFVKGKAQVSDLYPGQHRTALAENGEKLYVDRESMIRDLPAELLGATMIKTLRDNRDAGQLLGILLLTKHASTPKPDQIVLSWVSDPSTTQTITWRTDVSVKNAEVKYQEKRLFYSFDSNSPVKVAAQTSELLTDDIVNDAANHRHTMTLENLEPATTYVYSVGDANGDNWSALNEFTTAPSTVEPFSFMYLGDAQNGLDRWGSLMQTAHRMRPDMSFILMAGDLVNRGAQRDDWDDLFYNASLNFSTKPLMGAIGNHEYHGGFPELFLKLLVHPENGPATIEPERAYSFEYSNALYIVLDSNEDVEKQTAWLEDVLKNSDATWKFAMFHHPAYSSSPRRNNPDVQSEWVPLFDKYHVDMVLQGHDHAYLRTFPMKNGKSVESTKEGTVYVVSVSGTKMYDQGDFDYTAQGFTNTATFQILDIQIMGDRLLYKSYNDEGELVDEIVIEK